MIKALCEHGLILPHVNQLQNGEQMEFVHRIVLFFLKEVWDLFLSSYLEVENLKFMALRAKLVIMRWFLGFINFASFVLLPGRLLFQNLLKWVLRH